MIYSKILFKICKYINKKSGLIGIIPYNKISECCNDFSLEESFPRMWLEGWANVYASAYITGNNDVKVFSFLFHALRVAIKSKTVW